MVILQPVGRLLCIIPRRNRANGGLSLTVYEQHSVDQRGKGEKTAAVRQRQSIIVLYPAEVSLGLMHDVGPSTRIWTRIERCPFNVKTRATCLRNAVSETGKDFSLSVFVDKHVHMCTNGQFVEPHRRPSLA